MASVERSKLKTTLSKYGNAIDDFVRAWFHKTAARNNEVTILRKWGAGTWIVVVVIGMFFHFFFGAYIIAEAFSMRYDYVVHQSGKRGGGGRGALIASMGVGGVFSVIPILVDTRPLLRLVGRYSENHKEWIISLMVDGFFTVLQNLQSLEQKYSPLAASLHECAFIIIGVIITQIHIHYRKDATGLTVGTIVAVSKIMSGFGQLQFSHITWMEWMFGGVLLFTALFCQFTQGRVPTQDQASPNTTTQKTLSFVDVGPSGSTTAIPSVVVGPSGSTTAIPSVVVGPSGSTTAIDQDTTKAIELSEIISSTGTSLKEGSATAAYERAQRTGKQKVEALPADPKKPKLGGRGTIKIGTD